jgi:hypothetical protein
MGTVLHVEDEVSATRDQFGVVAIVSQKPQGIGDGSRGVVMLPIGHAACSGELLDIACE